MLLDQLTGLRVQLRRVWADINRGASGIDDLAGKKLDKVAADVDGKAVASDLDLKCAATMSQNGNSAHSTTGVHPAFQSRSCPSQ